jgi:hypothetical protein
MRSTAKFQFNLRLLLMVTTLFAVYLAARNYRTSTQQIALDVAVQDQGAWRVGIHHAHNPSWAGCFNRTVQLETIGLYDTISALELGSPRVTFPPRPLRITDNWLGRLNGQENLEFLGLNWTAITDEGILRLKHLPSLRSISLEGVMMSDVSAAHLSTFPTIERLDVSVTGITDEGVRSLCKSLKLKTLLLENTQITDKSLVYLSEMKSLERLFAQHIGDGNRDSRATQSLAQMPD